MSEQEYYDKVKSYLEIHGYSGPLDWDTVMEDYAAHISPEQSAEEFEALFRLNY